MLRALLFTLSTLAVFAQAAHHNEQEQPNVGTLKLYENFASKYADPRNVFVWLPEHYSGDSSKFSVLYMHDGQNLFEPATGEFLSSTWKVAERISALMNEGKIRDTIVVGIWNTSKRRSEYLPQKIIQYLHPDTKEALLTSQQDSPRSDGYLKFIVEELKPYIDKNYRTLTNRDNTSIMGSSMGGLISLYAISEYPEIFGNAGCISTHWPMDHYIQIGTQGGQDELAAAFFKYLEKNLSKAGNGHRIYFDFGTETLDALYEPYQKTADALMKKLGYTQGSHWITKKFPGAKHHEQSWQERLHIPLEFLLKPGGPQGK